MILFTFVIDKIKNIYVDIFKILPIFFKILESKSINFAISESYEDLNLK